MKNKLISFRWMRFLAIWAAILLATVACAATGTQPTSIPISVVATAAAQTAQAALPLASSTPEATAIPPTLTALLITATSPATAVPAPTRTRLPAGVRINFATGATAGIVEGQILQGQVKDFVLGAAAGQPLILSVDSPNHDVTLSVTGQSDGVVLLPASKQLSSWQTMLTKTQDYLIQLGGAAGTENFTLNVATPARVSFEPGAISAQRIGFTAGGLVVSYVLRANAGQKMTLKLDAPDGNAVLSVYGYQDGQPYLRYVAEAVSFDMSLPASEDYIIQVYPRAGAVARYTLYMQVK